MSKKVWIIILSVLFAFVLGVFLYDLCINGVELNKNIGKMAAVTASYAVAIIKILGGKKPRSLSYYKTFYEKEIGDAFVGDPKSLRKLLEAFRLYNESKFEAAIKKLEELENACMTNEDRQATGLLLALVYEEEGLEDKAVRIYEGLVERRAETDTILSNLGLLMKKQGRFERALSYFEKAKQINPSNPYVYNNIAGVYFNMDDLDKAEENAKKALWNNSKMHTSASLLAIIYSMRGDEENAKKYTHIAISNGQNPEALRSAIEHYVS